MTRPFPVGPRVYAGIAALLAFAGLGVAFPLGVLRSGHPLTAAFLALAATLASLFLVLIAFAPAFLHRLLAPWTRIDMHDAGHVSALMLLVASLYYVFGDLMSGGVLALEDAFRAPGATSADAPLDPASILLGVALNVALMVLPVVLYISYVGGTGPSGALARLGMRSEGAGRQVVLGLLMTIAFITGLSVLSFLLTRASLVPDSPNERALDIAKSLSWTGALAVSLGAAFSEEVFFRGFLVPRIGILAQAILFAALHLSYVNVLEIVATLSLALVLGIVRRRTGSLWGPLTTHFSFDLVMLLLGNVA